jgi:hypothetical protein
MEFKILYAKPRNENEYIIMCHLPTNSVTPYATWQTTTLCGDNRYWGHYFRTQEEALSDFQTR